MALPTLDRYRQANPTDTRTDSELLPLLVAQIQTQGNLDAYPDLAQYQQGEDLAFRKRNAPGYGAELANAVSSGIDTAQGQLYSTVAQAGKAAGSSGLEAYGMEGYHRNQQEAAVNAPTIGSYQDVSSVPDAIRYGLGVVGQNAPQLVGTVGATILGGLAGGPAGAAIGLETGGEGLLASLTARGIAAGLSATEARTIAAQQVARAIGSGAGSLASGGAASYTQTQNYGTLVDQGAEDALATSLAVGGASSLLESVVPLRLISKFGLGGVLADTGESLLSKQLSKVLTKVPDVARNIIAEGTTDAFLESGTEVAQELASIAGEEYANRNNPDFHITGEQIRQRLIDNGLGGFILGGGAGSLAGINAKHEAHAGPTEQASPTYAPNIPNAFAGIYDTGSDQVGGPTPFDEAVNAGNPVAPVAPVSTSVPKATPTVAPTEETPAAPANTNGALAPFSFEADARINDKMAAFARSTGQEKQAQEFETTIRAMGDAFQLQVHGDGLLASMLELGASLVKE